MTTLTLDAMGTLHGAVRPGPRRGVYCGFLVGSFLGLAFTGHLVAAAAVYTLTPVTCLFDFAV